MANNVALSRVFSALLSCIALFYVISAQAQVPSITSFSPTKGEVGTVVTITGTEFNSTPANNIVYFGAVKVTPSGGSANSLTVSVPAGATSITSIVVQDNITGLQASSTRQFTVTNTPIIQLNYARTDIGVGNTPQWVEVGDFNNDGNPDFATANRLDNDVSVRLGDGLGGFTNTANVAVGTEPTSIAISDFNGDGNEDLVIANTGSDDVSVRLGDGLGGFSGITTVAVGTNPREISIGDFNGDGNIDFATGDPFTGVSIRLGDGLGGFSGTTNLTAGSFPYSAAVGDFNGDGVTDLAIPNFFSDNVSIRIGDGAGGFTGTTNISVGESPITLALGDFNEDGNLDFATANFDGYSVSIRLGDGAGGFVGTTDIPVGDGATPYPTGIIIGDFNGDGHSDFATSETNYSGLSIALGDGTGAFSTPVALLVGNSSTYLATGDFNKDGKADIVVSNYADDDVSVLLWESFPIFTASTTTANFTENGSGIIFDFDANDGDGGATDSGIIFSVLGTDAAAFNISATGELSFTSSPDFENPTDIGLDNVYDVVVRANNGTNDTDVAVAITVLNGGDPFITTWSTTDGNITIPTTGTGYNYDITWTNLTNTGVGDGLDTGVGNTPYLISTLNPGDVYQIEISGTFPQIYFFGAPAEAGKILTVEQWGDIAWGPSQFYTFYNCTALTIPAVDAPDLSNVTNMTGFFSGASAFNDDISHWDVSNVENMVGMFGSAAAFNNGGAPLTWSTNTGTGMVTDMRSMFSGASSFNQDISTWDVSSVTDMSGMFFRATSFNQDIGNWDVSSVTNMYQMFREALVFSNGGAPLTWSTNTGTGIVTDMGRMFYEASSFNADISTWDVSSVLDMSWMFYEASSFNQDISTWDVSSVTDMNYMFRSASAFNNGGTALTWTTNGGTVNVTDMSNMFSYATGFNQDVSTWDVSSVTTMYQMFRNTYAFNNGGAPLTWTTNGGTVNVTDMSLMFFTSPIFNQDISTWDVSSVSNMYYMFGNASAFDQSLADWDISAVVSVSTTDGMNRMLDNSGLSTANYDATLTGWATLDIGAGETIIPTNINLGAIGLTYCAAVNDRTTLLASPYTWTFSGDAPGCVAPVTQASTVTFSNELPTGLMDMSWINGDGTRRIVVAHQGSAVNTNPTNGVTYVANSSFGSGSQIGSGNFVLYNGTGSNFTINDLTPGETYHFQVFEYNGTDGLEIYNLSTASDNPISKRISMSFITTWKTDNPGTSAATEIEIPLEPNSNYDFVVDWGDGNFDSYSGLGSGLNPLHDYGASGTYTVSISGTFPHIYFNNAGDREKILTIEQWGDIQWTSMENSFYGCSNLTYNLIDPNEAPDLSGVTSMAAMFRSAFAFDGAIGNWDVSTVTNMSEMFRSAFAFDQDIGLWNTISVENMSNMFRGIDFNQNINNWNTANVTDMSDMFHFNETFNQPLNNWVTSSVTNMNSMFRVATVFNQDISGWNTAEVLDMGLMFSGADAFNQNISGWNTAKVADMSFLFANDSFNQPIGSWNTSSATSMAGMFFDNTVFNQGLSGWNTSNVISTVEMFNGAISFDQDLSNWDIGNVANMTDMLNNTALSITNYDNSLVGWSVQTTQPNVPVGVAGLQYCSLGQAARTALIANGWIFSGDALSPVCVPEIDVYAGSSNSDPLVVDAQTTPVNFGSTLVGSAISQGLLVENNGNEDLVISSITVSAGLFSLTSAISLTIPPSSSELITIEFDASSMGTFNATVTINSDDLDESVFTFPIEANAVPTEPEIEVLNASNTLVSGSSTIDFGSSIVGTDLQEQLVINNLGTAALNISSLLLSGGTDYSISPASGVVPVGGTANFTITLSAATAGSFTDQLTISSDDIDEGSFVIDLQGTITVAPEPEIEVVNTSNVLINGTSVIDFGTSTVGIDLQEQLVINNQGSADLNITSITLSSGTDFSVSPSSAIISAGGSTSFTLTLNGIAAGSFSDQLIINSDDIDEGSFTISLQGTITTIPEPEIEIVSDTNILISGTSVIDFGTTTLGTNLQEPLVINNLGNADLNISSLTFSGGTNYSVTPTTVVVTAGGTANFTITLNASAAGNFSDQLTINSDDIDEGAFVIDLTGEVTEPASVNIFDPNTNSVIISGQDINVGSTTVNVEVDKSFEIRNVSTTDILTINSITVDNVVFQVINIPSTISPSSSATFMVRLLSDIPGQYSANVSVSTNINDFTFALIGEVLSVENPPLTVYNVVTPNGDNVHDFFKIVNIEAYISSKVSVFDRWGVRVFETTGYNNTSNFFFGISEDGEELLTGNYYYVIDKGNGDDPERGFILLKR